MKKVFFVFPLIAALCTVSMVRAASPTEVEGATTVDVAGAKALFDRGVPFVDVRGRSYSKGHIPGAVHLYSDGDFSKAGLARVAKEDEEVIIYCGGTGCNLSSQACKRAVSWGYQKVYYFRDGYPGWKDAGYPVER